MTIDAFRWLRTSRVLAVAWLVALIAVVGAVHPAHAVVITVDASSLSIGVRLTGGYFVPAGTSAALDVPPGDYNIGVYSYTVGWITVDSSGTITYLAEFEGAPLLGAGTGALSLVNHPVTVTDADLDGVAWVGGLTSPYPSHGITYNLVPGPLYSILTKPGGPLNSSAVGVDVVFGVNVDGTVEIDPSLSDILAGDGTSTVTLLGWSITIDSMATSGFSFISGLTNPVVGHSVTYKVSLGADYSIQSQPGGGMPAVDPGGYFAVDRIGLIHYSNDAIFTGEGTNTLGVVGFPVEVDASGSTTYVTVGPPTVIPSVPAGTRQAFSLPLGQFNVGTAGVTVGYFEVFSDGTCAPTEFTFPTGVARINCPPPYCGDGVLNSDEQCDDANALPGDGCRADCTEELCGDAILDPQEQCDDGNIASGDGCQANCALPVCGDAFADPSEECDDGNLTGGDGCSETCHTEVCGNGTVDPGEQCDDGNAAAGDGCRSDCTQELCGDGIEDPQEACDDANNDPGDGCRSDCTVEACGDGVQDPQEQCDDGNTQSGDGCQAGCVLPLCGDGVVDAGELCDDGNASAGDGCSATCAPEICGNGILDPGELCDDGNTAPADGCRANCTVELCGDGTLDPQEQCDDGNTASGDGCSAACAIEQTSGGEGCRPRFWRTHLGDWPAAYAPSTPFASVFDNAFPGLTLAQVLRQRGGGLKALGRQTVAALLNAADADVSYDLSPADVVVMFNDTYPGAKRAYNTLRKNFRQLNRQGCPLIPPHDDWCEDDSDEGDDD